MKVIRVAGPNDWEKEWKEIVASDYSQIMILFFGTESPETGDSWCSDCVIGKFALTEPTQSQVHIFHFSCS